MDRTVPRTGSEEIELYIRTYYSLLRSTIDVQIKTLEEAHASMGSSLHLAAKSPHPDITAFVYSILRLPPCIAEVRRVILGQSNEVFIQHGVGDVEAWESVMAKARRRRSFYDDKETLACYIASRSDIDDLIPMLTAFQIEWNKLYLLLQGEQVKTFLQNPVEGEEGLAVLAHGIGVELEDLSYLQQVWGDEFWPMMKAISSRKKRLRVRLLAGSLNDYRRATQIWWEHIESAEPTILHRPVYFVSSNPHSLVNLLSGFALRQEEELLGILENPANWELLEEWREIEAEQVPSSRENFLYYLLKKALSMGECEHLGVARKETEKACGVIRVPSEHGFDVEAQVIELKSIRPDWMDPRLRCPGIEELRESEALIINIDYPLGMAAYLILSHLGTRVGELRGVYIMGKAATLNGVVGDVMIPSVVHDEQSQNTYLFENTFAAVNVSDDLVYGTVLDNQKAVVMRGTFLQTPRYMDVFYREGYTDIEMEAGPYLSAIYEMYRPKRYPDNELVNLYGLPFDLGILHYASDTPLSKGRNLGAGSLSYFGMDPTYATSLAILRRIFELEISQLRGEPAPRPAPKIS
ncbi:MAG: hypothetical protein JSV37_05490 [Anaerolineaceae bacterium]|nr:MAG: hypothetical protein JSV37_05490 [Anaerolineaceae bacterium]